LRFHGFVGSSLFSVGKSEDREKIWNSGTQDVTDAKQRPCNQKKSIRKFSALSNLMLSNGESMEAEQSVKNAE
jgi:hypothetical protein